MPKNKLKSLQMKGSDKMKSLKAALVLGVCFLLLGCAIKEDRIDEAADDRNQPPKTVIEDEKLVPSGEEEELQSFAAEYSDSIAWSDDTILDMDDQKILYHVDYHVESKDRICSVAASADTVYVIVDCYGDEEADYILLALDRLGDDAEPKVLDKIESEMDVRLGYYNNTLYLADYSSYADQLVKEMDAYKIQEDGSLKRTKDELCKVIDNLVEQGYDICKNFEDFMTCLNEQNILFLRNRDSSVVASFDVEGNLIREYTIEPAVSNIRSTDGKLLLESCTGGNKIYNLEGGSAEQIGEVGYSHKQIILEIKDGCVYYFTSEEYAYSRSAYHFYRYDPVSGAEDLLFETKNVPGQPYVVNGVEGFTVRNDKCYFINYDDGCLWWFVCDLSDEDYALTRLEVVDEYRGIFDVASVGYEAKSYDCNICGDTMFEYYIETVTLSEPEIPCAGQINQYLQEKINSYIQEQEKYIQTELNQETDETDSDEHIHTYETRNLWFDGTTQYSFGITGRDEILTCLEVDIGGYEHYGGAHGYPTRERYIFDLQDGSPITFADICGISEGEFRKLAAEYTVKDYQEGNSGYFSTDEESLYETVYDYAGFDCLMHMNSKGVVIEYSPYFLGPYASGYIEVTIPYRDLGLYLTDIYGVNVFR